MFTFFSLFSVAARRLWNHRLLMGCLLAGLLAAVGLLASIPLYADAVQNRLLQGELTEAGTHRPPFAFLWRYIGAWHGDVSWAQYEPVDRYLTAQSPGVIDLPLFQQMNQQYGLTTILVTHDPQVAQTVDRVVTIRDGRTSSETIRRPTEVEAALLEGIAAAPQAAFEEYVVVDAAGRLQIPPHLRETVGIGGRVTLEPVTDGLLLKPVRGVNGHEGQRAEPDVQPITPLPSRWQQWWQKMSRQ